MVLGFCGLILSSFCAHAGARTGCRTVTFRYPRNVPPPDPPRHQAEHAISIASTPGQVPIRTPGAVNDRLLERMGRTCRCRRRCRSLPQMLAGRVWKLQARTAVSAHATDYCGYCPACRGRGPAGVLCHERRVGHHCLPGFRSRLGGSVPLRPHAGLNRHRHVRVAPGAVRRQPCPGRSDLGPQVKKWTAMSPMNSDIPTNLF